MYTHVVYIIFPEWWNIFCRLQKYWCKLYIINCTIIHVTALTLELSDSTFHNR